MKAIYFLPDDLKTALDSELQKRPKTVRIDWASLPGDKIDAVAALASSADRKHGFAIIAPALTSDELRRIDEVAGRPRAVFYTASKDTSYRGAMKEIYRHYHPSRRDILVRNPKALGRAVWLAGRTESLVRWNAVIPMAVLSAASVLFLFVLRDPMLRKAAIAGMQAAGGARAEVGGMSTTFTPSLEMTGVGVAKRQDPMRNLFDVGRLAGGVSLDQLIAGRVHIDELAMEGLRFGGARKESGALPGVEPEPEPAPVEAGSAPTLDTALSDILKKLEPPSLDDLETVRRAAEIEKEAKDRLAGLKKTLEDSPAPARLEQARKKLAELNADLPDSVRQGLAEIDAVRADLKGLDAAKADLEAAAKAGFDDERKRIDAARADVEKARESFENAERLIERAKEIKKVKITDLPRVKRLVDDAKASIAALETSAAGLQSAAKSTEEAVASVERKTTEAKGRLDAAGGGLAGARQLVREGGPALEQRFAAVSGVVAKARADLEAKEAEIGATLKGLKADMEQSRSEIEALRSRITADADFMAGRPDVLKAALEKDRARLASRYDLDAFNAHDLIGAAFGAETVTWLNRAIRIHGTLQPFLKRKRKEAIRTLLPEGTVYAFPLPEQAPPRVWIKKLRFSGSHEIDGEIFKLTGTATNLASDLDRTGGDATAEMTFEAAGRRIVARFRTTPDGAVTAELEASGFPVKGRHFDNPRAPVVIGDGTLTTRITASFEEASITADAHIGVEGLKVTLGEGADPRCAFLKDILSELDGLSADLKLTFAGGRIEKFQCRSGQGSQLTAAFRKAIEKQVAEAKRQVSSKLDELTAGPIAQAKRAVDGARGQADEQSRRLKDLLAAATPEGPMDPAARFADAKKRLDFPSDPAKAVEQLAQEVDALEKRRGDLVSSFASGSQELSASAASVKALAGDETKRLDEVNGNLKAELDRVIKEMR